MLLCPTSPYLSHLSPVVISSTLSGRGLSTQIVYLDAYPEWQVSGGRSWPWCAVYPETRLLHTSARVSSSRTSAYPDALRPTPLDLLPTLPFSMSLKTPAPSSS